MRYRTIAFSLLALASSSTPVCADSSLQYRLNGHDALQQIVVREGRVLIPGLNADPQKDFLFDRGRAQAAVIDHQTRTFITVDDREVERLRRQSEPLQPLLAGLGAQWKNLTPEQRAKWQSMLGGLDLERFAKSTSAVGPTHLAHGKKHQKVGGFECDTTTVLSGKKKLAEVCVSRADALGVPEDDYATIRSLLDFAQNLAAKTQGLSGLMGWSIPVFQILDIPGVPVEIRGFDQHKNETLSLASIDTAKPEIAPSMDIPQGYRHEPLKLW